MRTSPWRRNAPISQPLALAAILVAIALVAIVATLVQQAGPPLLGRAEVVDGDTLRMGAVRIRLLGLDAPELAQTCTDGNGADWPCGAKAKAFVETLVRGADLDCRPSGRDRYGRTLARCSTAGGDLGHAIVAAGWAISLPAYASEEAAARAAGQGIWAGTFVAPADWRRSHGEGVPGAWDWIRSWFH
jgi:endonuclease YncB( thermonuclease family)